MTSIELPAKLEGLSAKQLRLVQVAIYSLLTGVVLTALPVFLLRLTGVMDDSVFWVVGRSLNNGRVLYRDIYFTQPPIFPLFPQLLWTISSNIFVHRVVLALLWIVNGIAFYSILSPLSRYKRLVLAGLFLSSAFTLQSYSLHTEVLVLSCFLLFTLLSLRVPWNLSIILISLGASLVFFIKPVAPLILWRPSSISFSDVLCTS